MSLFKRFADKKKPTKAELNSFKMRLKVGDDPLKHWELQAEHWEKYKHHKETAMDLLRKLYKPEEVSKLSCYSHLEVWIFSSAGDCKESPIAQHIYMHHYGELNPRKDDPKFCLACKKELKL